jgi:hypothetical protein
MAVAENPAAQPQDHRSMAANESRKRRLILVIDESVEQLLVSNMCTLLGNGEPAKLSGDLGHRGGLHDKWPLGEGTRLLKYTDRRAWF